MITTLRDENGKRMDVDIPERDRLEMQRKLEKLGFKSINGYVLWLDLKYTKEREFFTSYPEYIRYCIKKELKYETKKLSKV